MKTLYRGRKEEYQFFRFRIVSGQGYKTKILYIGPAYCPNLTQKELQLKKFFCFFLTFLYFIFIILGGLPKIAVNSSLWHIISYVLSVLSGLILAYGEFGFLTSTQAILRAEWESYRDHIKIGTVLSAVFSCSTAIINFIFLLITLFANSSLLAELIPAVFSIIFFILSGICALLLQKIEHQSDYSIIPALEDNALDPAHVIEFSDEYERLKEKNDRRLKNHKQ